MLWYEVQQEMNKESQVVEIIWDKVSNFDVMKNKTEFYKPTENTVKQNEIRLAMAAELWQHELTNKPDWLDNRSSIKI